MIDISGSIPAALRRTAASHGDLDAIVDGDFRCTYHELDRAVLDAARGLLGLGVARGDRVAIWAQNCWQWCVAALAVAAAGAVVVPINTRFRGGEAAQVISDSRPVALFTTTGFLGADYPAMLRAAAPEHADLVAVVMTGQAEPGDLTWSDFLSRGSSISDEEVLERLEAVGTEDLSDIMYTSGTTGAPKGVMQTHGKNLQAITALGNALTVSPGDRVATIAPMFAQFGLRGGIYMNAMFGATTVVDAIFGVERAIELIEKERITVFPGPPTVLRALLSPMADGHDLSSLRVALIGSTVVPEQLVIDLLDKNIFRHVLTGWGLTEACGIVSVSSLTDTPSRIATTAGKVVDHMQVKIVDAEGAALPVGVPGKMLVRGATVMNGYLGDEAQTAQAIDADGWLDTGDIGLVNSDGYVQITGRAKDMVIVGGFNVYPAEVEAAMRTHRAVSDVALVGMPDERLGEVIAAFVVSRSAEQFDPEEFLAWCRGAMANHKVPRVVIELDSLPLNSSLKVDKPVLRRRAASMARPASSPSG
jgi:HIP---CoA ligase